MFGWIIRLAAVFLGTKLLRSWFGGNRERRGRDPLQRERQQRHSAR